MEAREVLGSDRGVHFSMAQCPIGQTEALGLWPCSRAGDGKRFRGQCGEQGDQVLRKAQNGTMSLVCLLQKRQQKIYPDGEPM